MMDHPQKPEIPSSVPADIDKFIIKFRVVPVDKDERMPVPGPNGGVIVLTRRRIDVQGHLFTVHTNAIHWFSSGVPENMPPGTLPIWLLKPRVVRMIERGAVRYHQTVDKGIFTVMVPEYCSQAEAKTLIVGNLLHIKELDESGKLLGRHRK